MITRRYVGNREEKSLRNMKSRSHSEVYCGYFCRLVFGNSLTFSHISPCFHHAKPPDFPHLLLSCKDFF